MSIVNKIVNDVAQYLCRIYNAVTIRKISILELAITKPSP